MLTKNTRSDAFSSGLPAKETELWKDGFYRCL